MAIGSAAAESLPGGLTPPFNSARIEREAPPRLPPDHCALYPPSTVTVLPVIHRDSFEARSLHQQLICSKISRVKLQSPRLSVTISAVTHPLLAIGLRDIGQIRQPYGSHNHKDSIGSGARLADSQTSARLESAWRHQLPPVQRSPPACVMAWQDGGALRWLYQGGNHYNAGNIQMAAEY
jgi:hypothetical protein